MTQDPKKPSWLTGGGSNQPPPSEPPDSPPNADDDADLPPWLREDAPPPDAAPRLKRLAPQPQDEQEGDLPPWLAGADEPEKPKTFKIGGIELSEEYLSGGDALPDTLDTEMTFDSWMAEREEAKREKDIEEEIPEDLLGSIEPDSEPVKSTGQLPDWFLGLEALDTTEAPEWFVADEEQPPPATAPLDPSWISDMFGADAAPLAEEDELPSAEQIGGLFTPDEDAAQDDDESSNADWYAQASVSEADAYSPGDDFFTQLVGGSSPPAAMPPDYSALTQFDSEDMDDDFAGASEQGAVEIPQNELDAFFDNLSGGRGQPVSIDELEDPELDWVAPANPPEDEDQYAAPERQFPVEPEEESASWLGELENIVASASRPVQTGQLPDLTTPEEVSAAWNAPPAPPDETAAAEVFQWGEPEFDLSAAPAAEPEAETPADDADWLSALSPTDVPIEDDEAPPEMVPPSRPRMTERLYRDAEPEPQPEAPAYEAPAFETPAYETPAEEEVSDWESLVSGRLTDSDEMASPFDASEAVEQAKPDQVEEFFASEDLFSEVSAYSPPAPGDEPLALFDEPDALGQAEDFFAAEDLFAGLPAYTPPEEAAAFPDTGALYGAELNADEDENALIPEDELNTGWLTDDLLDDEDEAQASPAGQAESDADFFSLLQTNSDANLLGEAPEDWNAGLPADESDLMSALDLGQAGSASEALSEADLYPSFDFGTDDEDEALPAAAEADALSQWQSEQPLFTDSEMERGEQWQDEPDAAAQETAAQDDDFFAMLNFDDAGLPAAAELPNTGDLISSWQDEPDEAEQPAVPPAAPLNTGYLVGAWQEQEAAAEAQPEDDFFASLGLDDDVELPSAAALPNTGDLIQQWQDQPDAAEQELPAEPEEFFSVLDIGTGELAPSEASAGSEESEPSWEAELAAEQEDMPDFFASLGSDLSNEAPAEAAALPNTGDLSSAWEAEEPLPAAAQEDDFFASLGMDTSLDSVEMPTLPNTGELISQWQDEDLPAETETTPDDFFASLGMETEEASAEAETAPEDFFASLGMETPDEGQPLAPDADPFANWDMQAETPPAAEFYNALDMIEGSEQEDIPDFFASLNEPAQEQPQAFNDVDSYLASLSGEPPPMTEAPAFAPNDEIDLDALFSEALIARGSETPAAPTETIPGADEDWLAQLQPSVGEVSASAIVRQQEDRPVEELSDRLKKLRQRAEEIPDEAPAAEADALTSLPFVGGMMAQAVTLTAEQQKRVEALKALVPVGERAAATRLSAIDATYDSPFMPDLEDTPETTVHPVTQTAKPTTRRRSRRRRGVRIRPDRFLVALVLAAGVLLPFILPGFRFGDLPPSSFAAGSAGESAFAQVDQLQADDKVLVGVEYGAASAAELDGITEALLRHMIMRGAFPVIVSANPVGLLRSEARIAAINRDAEFLNRISASEPLVQNIDYYLVRFLPGSTIGLRAFSADTANMLLSDIHGQASGLAIGSLNDFALVTVITDRADDLRAYAEQVSPLTSAPLVSAVSYGAAPLSEPYIRALGGGLLVGYRDAYTYADLLGTVEARSIAGRSRVVPTPEPVQIEVPALQEVTRTPRPTRPPVTPTLPPTQVPEMATVISEQPANVRGGAGTEFAVLAAVPRGVTLVVLGYNENRTWVNVRLEDGREGWISAALLSIEQPQASGSKAETFAKRQQVEEGDETSPTPRPTRTANGESTSTPRPTQTSLTEGTPEATVTEAPATRTPNPTRTPLPTATPVPTEATTEEATPETTPEATPEAAAALPFTLPPASPGYRDERWYAMNGGIIAAAFIITVGMLFNLLRGLLRRGRRG